MDGCSQLEPVHALRRRQACREDILEPFARRVERARYTGKDRRSQRRPVIAGNNRRRVVPALFQSFAVKERPEERADRIRDRGQHVAHRRNGGLDAFNHAEYLARRFLAKGSRQSGRERRREACAAFQRRAESRHAVAQLGDHALQSVAVRIRQRSRRAQPDNERVHAGEQRQHLAAVQQQGTRRRRHRADAENGILRAVVQRIEPADQVGNALHHAACGRHQPVGQRNRHILRAAFKDRQIALEVVAHRGSHVFRRAAAGIHALGHLVQRVGSLLERRQNTLERFVAEDRAQRRVALAGGHFAGRLVDVADDGGIRAIAPVCVGQRDFGFTDGDCAVLGVVLHIAQHGVERRAALTALDARVRQHAHRCRRILQGHAESVRSRRGVFHRLAQSFDRGVAVRLRIGKHVGGFARTVRRHAERSHRIGHDIRGFRQIHVGGSRQIQHARNTGDDLRVIPARQRHIAHRVGSFAGAELGRRAHLARRIAQRVHLCLRQIQRRHQAIDVRHARVKVHADLQGRLPHVEQLARDVHGQRAPCRFRRRANGTQRARYAPGSKAGELLARHVDGAVEAGHVQVHIRHDRTRADVHAHPAHLLCSLNPLFLQSKKVFGNDRLVFGHLQKPRKEKADGAPAPSVRQPISRRIISAASALVVAFCLPFRFSSRAGLLKSGSRFSRAC